MDKLFTSILDGELNLKTTILVIAISLVLGFIISVDYLYVNRKRGYSSGFVVTLIMLPVTIAVIILLVENSIARAFSLAGAFALIRFRSAPGDPLDISFIFFTLAVGLACGIGYVGYAFIFTVIILIVVTLIHIVGYGKHKPTEVSLKISIPENINYQGAFDEVFSEYANSWEVKKVKTSDFGAIFVVEYLLMLKKEIDQKAFIDELRCRNGNLNIVLTVASYKEATN